MKNIANADRPKSVGAMLPPRPFRGSGKVAQTACNSDRREGKSCIPTVNQTFADSRILKISKFRTFRIADSAGRPASAGFSTRGGPRPVDRSDRALRAIRATDNGTPSGSRRARVSSRRHRTGSRTRTRQTLATGRVRPRPGHAAPSRVIGTYWHRGAGRGVGVQPQTSFCSIQARVRHDAETIRARLALRLGPTWAAKRRGLGLG